MGDAICPAAQGRSRTLVLTLLPCLSGVLRRGAMADNSEKPPHSGSLGISMGGRTLRPHQPVSRLESSSSVKRLYCVEGGRARRYRQVALFSCDNNSNRPRRLQRIHAQGNVARRRKKLHPLRATMLVDRRLASELGLHGASQEVLLVVLGFEERGPQASRVWSQP